jgi:hypothetical protein
VDQRRVNFSRCLDVEQGVKTQGELKGLSVKLWRLGSLRSAIIIQIFSKIFNANHRHKKFYLLFFTTIAVVLLLILVVAILTPPRAGSSEKANNLPSTVAASIRAISRYRVVPSVTWNICGCCGIIAVVMICISVEIPSSIEMSVQTIRQCTSSKCQ